MTQGDVRVNTIMNEYKAEKENLDDIKVYTRHKGVSIEKPSKKKLFSDITLAIFTLGIFVIMLLGAFYYGTPQ